MFGTRDGLTRLTDFIGGKQSKFIGALVALVCALTLTMGPAAAATLGPGVDPGGARLVARLTGSAEVPPADLGGSGSAVFTLNPGLGIICYELTVSGLSATPVAAHIHVAPVGVSGPVVVPLMAPTSGFVQSCTSVSRDLILAILQNPSAYYVNVHTAVFPAGAIRGQLSR